MAKLTEDEAAAALAGARKAADLVCEVADYDKANDLADGFFALVKERGDVSNATLTMAIMAIIKSTADNSTNPMIHRLVISILMGRIAAMEDDNSDGKVH